LARRKTCAQLLAAACHDRLGALTPWLLAAVQAKAADLEELKAQLGSAEAQIQELKSALEQVRACASLGAAARANCCMAPSP
jgi:uncharacterized membrane protein YccC